MYVSIIDCYLIFYYSINSYIVYMVNDVIKIYFTNTEMYHVTILQFKFTYAQDVTITMNRPVMLDYGNRENNMI